MAIPIFRPYMDQEEIDAVTEVLNSRWWGLGPKTDEFEYKFAKYIGSRFAVATNSCTTALHLALESLDISSGEVIVPAITFISTALAPLYTGAKPVFADVNEDTLTIDVEDIKRKLTPETKAIIVVHYGGHPCEMDEIMQLAKENNLKVIEDCAHSCGASYKGKKTGSFGDAACFSFHPVKNLATPDGGMITTDDREIKRKAKRLRWVGINRSTFERTEDGYDWHYEVAELGFKAHMNDFAAAIGLVQLKRLDEMNKKRAEIVAAYNNAFKDIPWIEIPLQKEYINSSNHIYAIKTEHRDDLIEHLKRDNISAGVHYMPMHLHPIFKDYQADVPVSERIWKKLVTLPVFPDLTKEQLNLIIETIKKFK